MILPLKGCDMVLGVQWLLSLGDIIWNFSSLTMQFKFKEEVCIIQGIVHGSLAVESLNSSSRRFSASGHSWGPYAMVLSSSSQIILSALMGNDSKNELQELWGEFANIFQLPNDLPPSRLHDHRIPLKDEGMVVKVLPYRYPAIQKGEIEKLI